MNFDLNVSSESAREAAKEVTIVVKTSGYDVPHAILKLLAQMKRDCDVGHGSLYIMDAEGGDDKAEVYIDGDGGAGIASVTYSVDGGSPVAVSHDEMKNKAFKFY